MISCTASERYLDYRLATSQTGQTLRNFAERHGLPRETVASVLQLQTEAGAPSRAITRATEIPRAPPGSNSLLRLAGLEQQIQKVLGPAVIAAWINGKSLRPELYP